MSNATLPVTVTVTANATKTDAAPSNPPTAAAVPVPNPASTAPAHTRAPAVTQPAAAAQPAPMAHPHAHAAAAPTFHQEEKKTTAATGEHEAHHPSKPAIHPTPATAAASSVGGAANGAPKHHHYSLMEELNGSLWTLSTSKSWKSVCEDLPLQATAHKFSIVGKHDLQESLVKKGLQFKDEAMIFELCNAQMASNVLTEQLALSAVLPCRLSVTARYGESGCCVHLFLPTTLLANCCDQKKATDDQLKQCSKFQEMAEHITTTLKEIAKKAAK